MEMGIERTLSPISAPRSLRIPPSPPMAFKHINILTFKQEISKSIWIKT